MAHCFRALQFVAMTQQVVGGLAIHLNGPWQVKASLSHILTYRNFGAEMKEEVN
jgi:hypothetical protein